MLLPSENRYEKNVALEAVCAERKDGNGEKKNMISSFLLAVEHNRECFNVGALESLDREWVS